MEDRNIWTAKLFQVNYQINSSEYKYTLPQSSWIQYLHPMITKSSMDPRNIALSGDLMNIIHVWRKTPRLSLSDLLAVGDSEVMYDWRLFMIGLVHYYNTNHHISVLSSTLDFKGNIFNVAMKSLSRIHRIYADRASESYSCSIAVMFGIVLTYNLLNAEAIEPLKLEEILKVLETDVCPSTSVHSSSTQYILSELKQLWSKLVKSDDILIMIQFLKRISISRYNVKIAKFILSNLAILLPSKSHAKVLFLCGWLYQVRCSHNAEMLSLLLVFL